MSCSDLYIYLHLQLDIRDTLIQTKRPGSQGRSVHYAELSDIFYYHSLTLEIEPEGQQGAH